MLTTLAVANYRSLRNLIVPLRRLNLITGPNGSGKSNVYRALRLLAETAQGGVIPSLAREGGLQSTLWAGPENVRTLGQARRASNARHRAQGTRQICGWDSPATSSDMRSIWDYLRRAGRRFRWIRRSSASAIWSWTDAAACCVAGRSHMER